MTAKVSKCRFIQCNYMNTSNARLQFTASTQNIHEVSTNSTLVKCIGFIETRCMTLELKCYYTATCSGKYVADKTHRNIQATIAIQAARPSTHAPIHPPALNHASGQTNCLTDYQIQIQRGQKVNHYWFLNRLC